MDRIRDAVRLDSAFWRKLAWYGATRGPRAWLEYSPPAVGLLIAAISSQQRRRVRDNLRAVLGQRPLRREAVDVARTFMNFASTLADSFAITSDSGYALDIRVDGADRLQKAVAGGRGVVMVTAHTAGWEIALTQLKVATGVPVYVAMSQERDRQARSYHALMRSGTGMQVVEVGDDPLAALPLLGHLRSGAVVAIQVDRCPEGMRRRCVRAFGGDFEMPEGPFALAAASQAPILTAFTSRVGLLAYRITLSDPILVAPRAQARELDRAAQRVAWELEGFIRRNPTQWFHFGPA